MQVSVEATSSLERRMTVTVPAERVDKEVENRLKSLTRTVRIAGFRPGKVPLKVVTTRYGNQVRNEVIGELTQSSFQEAVNQENLRLAGMPKIEHKQVAPGKDLEYTAIFEVFEDIELAPMGETVIEKPIASITDEDVNAMVDKLRQQRAEWVTVERPAQDKDRLTIDFEGTIEGEVFEGNSGTQVPIILGSNSFIPGFEEALIGKKAGEETQINLVFPDDYRSTAVAGKPVCFTVKVHEVAEADLPEIDAEFMSTFEVSDGNMDSFISEIRGSMETELAQVLQDMTKTRVLDVLYDNNTIDVPSTMIESAIDDMKTQMRNSFGAQAAQVDGLERELFEPGARRKAALGMLMNEISRQQGFRAAPDEVKKLVDKLASSYDESEEVVRWYYSDRSRLANIESLVVEEMVVNWVLDNAKVSEKAMSFDEVMQKRQG